MAARDATLADVSQALNEWFALYRIHFADHPAPAHAPLRRMVFLPFAVWPNAQHDLALARANAISPRPLIHPPEPRYHLQLALADVARALPNASPSRPAPPLHVASSGDEIGIMGERLGGAMNVRMTVHFRAWVWVTRYDVNGQHRYNPLLQVWRTAMRMDDGLYEPDAPRHEAEIMCALWHTEESKPRPHEGVD